MLPREKVRLDQADLYPSDNDPAVLTMLARGSEPKAKTDDDKIHIFWRVFGGAIVSVIALAALTLYNNVQSSIVELRAEMTKLNDLRGEYVRKDEFNNRISNNYERVTAVAAQNTAHTSTLAGMKSECDSLREKCAGLMAEVKSAREESLKTRLDLEKNQSADQERKTRRDEQHKDLEKGLKDLATALQECQVKLARLEGQQTKPKEQDK